MGNFTLPYPHLPAGLWKTTKILIQVITVPAGVRNGNQKPFRSSRLARWWPRQALAVSRFQDDRHMKVVRPVSRTDRHYSPRKCQRLSRPQGHCTAGRMSIKNSNDTIENRIRDLPAYSAVSEPTAPPWMSGILPPSQPICRIENFHPPGHAVATAVLMTAIKDASYSL